MDSRSLLAAFGLGLLCTVPGHFSVPLTSDRDVRGDLTHGPVTELDYSPEQGNRNSRLGVKDRSVVIRYVKQEAVFQGDILGVKDPAESIASLRDRLRTGIPVHGRWTAGKIPYVISNVFSASQRQVILTAMDHIHQNTAATRFIPRTTHADYVHVVPIASGCFSHVGNRKRGAQEVYLANDCLRYQYVVIHELMHAAGFEHEQTRPDRDNYVEILYDNIVSDWFYAYDVQNSRDTFGLPYDIKSIMHYQGHEFAKKIGLKTIRARPPRQNEQLGSSSGLTSTDKAKLNAMYPLCARAYLDPALKGRYWTFGKNDDADLSSDGFDTMSSASVTEGCTLTVCKLTGYRGQCVDLKGVTSGYYEFSQFNWDNQARSYKCRCD